ncbi:hypothetical protein [Aeromicrobium alkaliterrae]|uniref:Type IV secretion system protein n=1 Tax=Aeromicrobium alkaliterrae TaxID=302168 RepID=A0ABP4WBM3_9ACTN
MSGPAAALPAVDLCPDIVPACKIGETIIDTGTGVVQDGISSVAGDVVQNIADSVGEAVADVLISLATMWVEVPTPGLGEGSAAERVQGNLFWFMAALAVLSVIIGGMKTAWEQRGEPLKELLRSLMQLVLVSAGTLIFIGAGVKAGDDFSAWIISKSTQDGSFDTALANLFGGVTATGAATGAPALAPMLVIILGLIAILTTAVQIVLMYFRSAVLIVLAGVLPLSASMTNTEGGRQWFGKTMAWAIAFMLYKPAAAIIYASALSMDWAADGFQGALVGICMMCIAIFALPATMRLVVPATSAVAGSSGGAASGAAAMGAASMMSGGGGGGGRTSGPTGAAPAPHVSSAPAGSTTAGGGSGRLVSSTPAAAGKGAGAASGGGAAAAGSGAAAAAGPAAAAMVAGQAAAGAVKSASNRGVQGE